MNIIEEGLLYCSFFPDKASWFVWKFPATNNGTQEQKKSLCKMVQVSTRAFLILKSDLFRPCWFDQERQTTLLEQEKKEIHRWEWKTHVRWNIPPFEIRSDWFKRHYNENFFSSQCWWWEKRATIIHLSIIGDFFSDCTLLYSQQLPFHTSN